MRQSSAAVALLAPAVVGGLGLPAAASAHTGPPQARAAWVTTCELPVEGTSPCGPWHLLLRDGRKVTVSDSAARAKGRATSLFALSGDGRTIVYQRARDHRLVVRAAAGGPVRELPSSFRPGGEDGALFLSPAGDRVLAGGKGHVKVLTLATGRITRLTVKGDPAGFSGDGDEVLATRDLSDGTKWLYSHGLDGRTLRSAAPQFVANAVALALSSDGHTVAAFSSGDPGRGTPPRTRTYDLETARLSDGVNLPLTSDTPPDHARWAPDGTLVVYSYDSGTTKSTVVRVLTVDPASGQARRTDTYKVGPDSHTIVFPGE
ncbi:hypothetical protein ABZ815_40625 [Nonomuraea sp. NPDC047529]|uniref:TolB family protein n=1 Tax=Nonomuraea sp. NPDC047529 TaxID=3155623 RepID=UPI0033D51D51